MQNKEEAMTHKTFEEMGVIFTEGSGCKTCRDNSCHNIVPLKATGEEYSVHISTDPDRSIFTIVATTQASVSDSDEISKEFTDESEAVKFVCKTFSWFNCY
jgi:hypothetical protein